LSVEAGNGRENPQRGPGIHKKDGNGTTRVEWPAGTPAKVFDAGGYTRGYARDYDVSPDGQRFLMIKDGPERDQLIVVERWFEELRARVKRTSATAAPPAGKIKRDVLPGDGRAARAVAPVPRQGSPPRRDPAGRRP